MTSEQQRAILEAAAKACGITLEREISGKKPHRLIEHESGEGHISVPWNPLTNSADTASMCAKLNINYTWMCGYAECWKWDGPSIKIEHDGTPEGKEAAWRLAASMVAAKVGGYTE